MKKKTKYPAGWNEARVQRVLDYYENQTEDEGAAEIEAACKRGTMVQIPADLLPAVRRLIARRRVPVKRSHSALPRRRSAGSRR